MAAIFVSYSSKDRGTARRLASDLKTQGHRVWLDEWEIHVGECIPSKIEEGIGSADFLIILLSRHAVQSPWVDREWRAAYWAEVSDNKLAILPVRVEPCSIPLLLQAKKYADLADSYERGLQQLAEAIAYYSRLQKDKDFFRAIPTVWAEDRSLTDSERVRRNDHWDRFERVVTSLPSSHRKEVQVLNSLHYIEKYSLKVSELKAALQSLGVFAEPIDDTFTDELVESITAFQRLYNLRHCDGVFGPLTYLAMAQAVRAEDAKAAAGGA